MLSTTFFLNKKEECGCKKDISALIVIIGISDFSPGRAILLSKIGNLIGYRTKIITNRPIYLKNDENVIKRDIISLDIPALGYNSILGRLFFYLLFSFLCLLKLLRIIRKERYKRVFIIARHPYPFSVILSLIAKWLLKSSREIIVIADITDLWPESLMFMSDSIISKIVIRVGLILNRFFYKRIDGALTHNVPFKKYIQEVYLEGLNKIIFVIPHLVDTSLFKPIQKEHAIQILRKMAYLNEEESKVLCARIVFGYVGLISHTIGSKALLEFVDVVKNDPRFALLIVGEGSFKRTLEDKIRKENIQCVYIKDTIPHEKIPLVINATDIGIVTSFPNSKHFSSKYCMPKKFIEYCACAKPIIYIGYSAVISSYIRQYSAGISIEKPANREELLNVIHEIIANYSDLSKNASQLSQKFSCEHWLNEFKKFLSSFT
ncbi:MAG: glycosyltransferase [Candidatus Bathyarchaeia archaeon]